MNLIEELKKRALVKFLWCGAVGAETYYIYRITDRRCRVKKYTVHLEMANGAALVFETNEADDERQAMGLAIVWAVENTGEQVLDARCIISDGGV